MTTHRFTVERIDITLGSSFEQAVGAFETNVPVADRAMLDRLVEVQASADAIREAIEGAQGDLGFMVLAKLSQGGLTSLLGRAKKISVYLMGNPVIANRMFERNPAAGLYAPLRVSLYEDQKGAVHFAYDRPSSLLGSFGDGGIDEVAALLDDKMATLAKRLEGSIV